MHFLSLHWLKEIKQKGILYFPFIFLQLHLQETGDLDQYWLLVRFWVVSLTTLLLSEHKLELVRLACIWFFVVSMCANLSCKHGAHAGLARNWETLSLIHVTSLFLLLCDCWGLSKHVHMLFYSKAVAKSFFNPNLTSSKWCQQSEKTVKIVHY